MPLATPVSIALGRFKRLPQRTAEVWQGGIVRFPMWVDNPADPEGPPLRATGAIWVSLRTGLVHVDLAKEGEDATPELALATLLEFGLKWAKELDGRPGRIEVRDPGLRDALAAPLAALDTRITLVEDQPAVRDALRSFEEHEVGERMPGLLDSRGMSIERLRAFADAAATFYAARPWERLGNEDLIVVESERAPRDMRHLCVLGRGGQEFGVSFFDSRRAFERLLDLTDAGKPPTRAHGVTFDNIDALPFADVDAWQDHALAVAGPDAYPLAADLRLDGSMRRPDPRALSYSEGLLRAVAETTEDELDTAAWQKRVETFDGPLHLRLSMPYLLEAEAGRASRRTPAGAMPRIAERANARIARLLASRSFESMDAVNAELERLRADGALDADAADDRDLSPLERAQELAYDAMEAHGRLRVKRARQALAISQDCADAWIVLAEETSTPEAAIELYERAMRAGAAAIGAERFESLRGEFWGHLDTRPYMRARLGLAQALSELERHVDAIAHYRALLELNPGDNQGVRYLLLVQLLQQGPHDEAGRLLAEYGEDMQALWPYGRLLWRYRTEGDATGTREAFSSAVIANPHVVNYLLDPDSMPSDQAPSFALGSREEAAYVADTLGHAFVSTDGALEWLAAQMSRSRRTRPGRGRRGR
jgi:tetratricopeptide (TPR) repeat protein